MQQSVSAGGFFLCVVVDLTQIGNQITPRFLVSVNRRLQEHICACLICQSRLLSSTLLSFLSHHLNRCSLLWLKDWVAYTERIQPGSSHFFLCCSQRLYDAAAAAETCPSETKTASCVSTAALVWCQVDDDHGAEAAHQSHRLRQVVAFSSVGDINVECVSASEFSLMFQLIFIPQTWNVSLSQNWNSFT